MKKLFLGMIMFSAIAGMAQTEKGGVLVGGAFSLQTTSGNSRFAINPNVGFFPLNNFAAGAALNLLFSKQGDIKNSQFGIGPYLRYYIGKAKAKPFVATEVSYLYNKYKTTTTSSSANGFGFLLGIGLAAFINETVAVEALTGYNYSDFSGTASANGFTMRIGFQLYFNRNSYDDLKTNVIGK